MNRISDRMLGAGLGRVTLITALALSALPAAAEQLALDISGYSWSQVLRTGEMYKGAANFDNQSYANAGGMLFLNNKVNDHWTTDLSLGIWFGNTAIKKTLTDTNGAIIGRLNPNSLSLGMGGFLHEAAVSFGAGPFSMRIGKFHFVYSEYNHDFGLYLLRGPVYPGFLYSGNVDEIGALTKTGMLLSLQFPFGLKLDLLPSFETDFKPYMDLNVAGFASYKIGPVELGGGVEVQRLVETQPCVTSPEGAADVIKCLGGDPTGATVASDSADLYKSAYLIVDTTGGKNDTLTYSMAGTKVMGRAALDFKKIFFEEYPGSPKDFVLYFETALIGTTNYKFIYEHRGERMPMLFGFNVPTFGFMDLVSLELEYYNSPYQNDPYKLVGAYDVFQFSDGNSINYAMSPIPPSNKAGSPHLSKAQEDFDPKKDNLKWSVYLAKKVADRITFKLQLASDHWRTPNNNFVQYEAAASPGQFYTLLKVDYVLK